MLEEIMQMIKQHGQNAVVNNADVPNEHNDAVMNEAGSSVMSMLQNMVQNGQGNEVNNMLQDPSHPAVQQMQSNFADNIMQKFGLSSGAASNVASSLIPNVLQSVLGKFQGGGFNLSQITQSLSGGGIGNIAAKFGLDKDGDGDVDLDDAKKMFGF